MNRPLEDQSVGNFGPSVSSTGFAVPPVNAWRKRRIRRSSPRLKRISLLSGDQTGLKLAWATSASVKRKTEPSRDRSSTHIVGYAVSGSSNLLAATYLSLGER